MAPPRDKNADAPRPSGLPDPRAILNSIGEAVYDWDIVTDRLVFGPNTAEIPDVAEFAKIASGRAYAEYLAPESPSSRFEAIMSSAESDCGRGVSYKVIYGLLSRTSARARRAKIIWIEDTGRWFAGSNNRPARAHGLVRVITDRYEAERQLARQSRYDALTGALNRAHFIEHVSALLPECLRKGVSHAILLAGIDNLAVLNEAYGYDVGDELIAVAAERLRGEMRTTDLMARYVGNKFALFLDTCTSEQMNTTAERFLSTVEAAPLATKAGQIALSVRVGGVVIPQQGRSAQVALHHAEEALASTRRSGGNRFIAYTPSLVREDKRLNILHVSDEIVAALNGSRITLALQPVVSAKSGEIAFYEALARLSGEDGKARSAGQYFPGGGKDRTGAAHRSPHARTRRG